MFSILVGFETPIYFICLFLMQDVLAGFIGANFPSFVSYKIDIDKISEELLLSLFKCCFLSFKN